MAVVGGEADTLLNPLYKHSIAGVLSVLLKNYACRDQLASQAIPNAKRVSWHNAARERLIVFEKATAAESELIGHFTQ